MVQLVTALLAWSCAAAAYLQFSLLLSLLSSRSRPSLALSSREQQPPSSSPWYRLSLHLRTSHDVDSLEVTSPPPHSQLNFNTSSHLEVPVQFQTATESVQIPLFALREDRKMDGSKSELQPTFFSEPAISSPLTTIKFTLDDVPVFWQPQSSPSHLAVKSNETYRDDILSLLRKSSTRVSLEASEYIIDSLTHRQTPRHLFIVTPTGRSQPSATPQTRTTSELTGHSLDAEESLVSSLTLPFLENSTEESLNTARLRDLRTPVVTRASDSRSNNIAESNIFTTKPIKTKSEVSIDNIVFETSEENGVFSKSPVPKITSLSEEKNSYENVDETEKPRLARKTINFNQEFLALLKNYNPREKNDETTTEVNSFLLSNLSKVKTGRVWSLKGGARSPSITSSSKDDAPPYNLQQNIGGVFTASLLGFMAATAKLASNTTLTVVTEGPRIISVGEVGEVPHETQETLINAASLGLSAALKHGIQSLNVSAWVSGCPKLYGKVALNCAIHHDALVNTAMKVTWKKKMFSEGHLEEQVIAEGDLLKVQEPRFTLEHHLDQYHLIIKDFRAKDCGTYECEARAAGTTAASQLLLFTCL